MATEYADFNIPAEKLGASRKQRVFSKAFGIPGLISAIISMWFTVAQSFVAITASEISEIVNIKIFYMSVNQIMNIPLLALCFCAVLWAILSVVLCVLSRFLGQPMKISQTGFVLSIVSSICSVSLTCFSIVYMILA